MNSIETDIYRGIDMAFHWFKKNNPTLDVICDEETLEKWYDFITWCYAQDGEGYAFDNVETLKNEKNPDFDFILTSLMEEAMTETDAWWCKYNTDHQQVAEDEFKEDCDPCDGTGYLDEDYEQMCEDCDGVGKDPDDEESHWDVLEEAYEKILSSVDTTGFKDLTKVEI